VSDKKAIKIEMSVLSHVVDVCVGVSSICMCHISLY
jgi:hypothetical protein